MPMPMPGPMTPMAARPAPMCSMRDVLLCPGQDGPGSFDVGSPRAMRADDQWAGWSSFGSVPCSSASASSARCPSSS